MEQSQTPALVVLVFGAVPVLLSKSGHSELCTQQTLQCHSNPATNKTRTNHQLEKKKTNQNDNYTSQNYYNTLTPSDVTSEILIMALMSRDAGQ